MITELIALNYDLDRITSYFPVVGGKYSFRVHSKSLSTFQEFQQNEGKETSSLLKKL